MIPDGSVSADALIPKKPTKVELCPDPVECSESGCKEPPVIAYWQEGNRQFDFACEIHQHCHSSNGRKLIEQDSVEDYNKKRKRKIYHKHFPEYIIK